MSLLHPADWPLRRKLAVLVLSASTVPLLFTLVLGFLNARASVRDGALALLEARTDQMLDDFDQFHATQLHRVEHLAQREALRRPAERSAAEVLEALEHYREEGWGLYAAAVVDRRGVPLAGTGPAPRLTGELLDEALAGRSTISPLYLDAPERGGRPLVAYAAPIRGEGASIQGIVVTVVEAAPLWELVLRVDRLAGEGSFATVLDAHGIRIAHTSREAELFRPVEPLPPNVVDALAAQDRFGPRTRELLETPRVLEGLADTELPEPDPRVLRLGSPLHEGWNLCTTRAATTVPWTLVYCVPEESLTGPALEATLRTTAISAVLVVLALAGGLVLANLLARPIDQLSVAAGRLGQGDLDVRVDGAHRKDEVGRLALAFNAMAADLEGSRRDLEDRIAARTAALQAARDELAERNEELSAQAAGIARSQARALAYARTLAALGGEEGFEEGLRAALREIAAATRALVVVCYRVRPGETLQPLASYAGGDVDAETVPLGGLAREALRGGALVQVEDLPPELQLRFDAGLVRGVPRVAALMPLLVREGRVGFLALGLARPLSEAMQELLVDLAMPFALTMVRHDLAQQRDRLTEELARQNEELTVQAEELQGQSEELVAQQRELLARNEEIEGANRLKSDFLANMSHELRTPLNTVIGFSDLLLSELERSLDERHVRYLQDVHTSGRHLLGLINDILDLARIEAGRVELDPRPTPVARIIREAVAILHGAAASKGITITEVAPAGLEALVDPDKLRQVLINLLSNAVKFSATGAAVEVGASEEGTFVRFWVRDEGPGIQDSLRSRLFQPFVQGEGPLNKRHEGTGLGLTICRKLVESHGGTIDVVSAPGAGSTFTFTMPACASQVEAPRGDLDPVDERAGAAFLTKPFDGDEALQLVTGLVQQPAPKRPRVLVVDDDPAVGILLAAILEPAGYEVLVAHLGREGLELARTRRIDAVILDLRLPDISGPELVLLLRSDRRTRALPVLVLTAETMDPVERERLTSQVLALTEKGEITPAELLGRLQAVAPAAPAAGLPAEPPRILIVEDNALNADLCRILLGRAGYEVLLARDGDEGVEMALRDLPALILMDLAMPRRDGFSAMKVLRSHPEADHIPIVAVTARAMRSDQERACAEGFAAFLTKPIDGRLLIDTVRRLLSPFDLPDSPR